MEAVLGPVRRASLRLIIIGVITLIATLAFVGRVQAHAATQTAEQAPFVPTAEMIAADTVKPTAVVSARFSKCVWKALRVNVRASDASGVASVDFSIDGHKLFADTVPSFGALLSVARLTHGHHMLEVRTRDNAGNVTVTSKRFRRCTHRARTVRRIQPRFTG